MRILVVEDSRDLNRVIVKTLASEGYAVDGCFDGEEALTFLVGQQYDCIIVDVMMPKLDGFSLVKRLRAEGNATPVLFLTARDSVEDKVKGLDMGGDYYLVKPFHYDELLACVRAITRKYTDNRTNVYTLADLSIDTAAHTVT
ncbi:MAG: response regulator, partial [Eubacteriales bacterium]|nr:response regulator [Eubacteriales bacterium]